MHTDRITRGFGGVLVLLGFWQLSVQLFAGLRWKSSHQASLCRWPICSPVSACC